jgi:hypothetical protein
MKARGGYVTADGRRDGEVVFWGEWEPESRVLHRYDAHGGMPHFLYEPFFVPPATTEWRQNTDPFVFGDCFLYTGCMQHTKRGATQVRHLSRGSIVLFGSHRGESGFVLDTAFVVDRHIDHDRSDHEVVLGTDVSDTYRTVTIEPWYRGGVPQAQSHRLYFGATVERPVGRMYSFFPCQPYDDAQAGFARPTIRLPGVNARLRQGKKITRGLDLAELERLWSEIVGQVRGAGLALGVRAELPARSTGIGEMAGDASGAGQPQL